MKGDCVMTFGGGRKDPERRARAKGRGKKKGSKKRYLAQKHTLERWNEKVKRGILGGTHLSEKKPTQTEKRE